MEILISTIIPMHKDNIFQLKSPFPANGVVTCVVVMKCELSYNLVLTIIRGGRTQQCIAPPSRSTGSVQRCPSKNQYKFPEKELETEIITNALLHHFTVLCFELFCFVLSCRHCITFKFPSFSWQKFNKYQFQLKNIC